MFTKYVVKRFLTNGKNKARFIHGLTGYLEHAGIQVINAVADADTLIVRTAIELSTRNNNVVVVGTDVDLLILLIQLSKQDSKLYLYKPGTGKYPDKVFSISCIQRQIAEVSGMLLFLHAMTGCDTTSALYRQGKKKAFTLLQKKKELWHHVKVFNDPTSSPDSVSSAGEQFLLALYGAPKTTTSLNVHRHKRFTKAVAKCPVQNKINLAALPPTSAAAKEHSFRVYHQVQHWLGVELPPTEWGWGLVNGQLQPILTRQPPAPEKLFTLISCNCKSGCERSCGCRKAGLYCTILCGHCHGNGCSNSEKPVIYESDTDGDHDFVETESDDDFNADVLMLRDDEFEMTHDDDSVLEDQSDECDFTAVNENPRKRKYQP